MAAAYCRRGSPAVAVEALEDVLQRVARPPAVVPELAELDFNPVIVSTEGIEVVDSRVRIAPAPPAPESTLRRESAEEADAGAGG